MFSVDMVEQAQDDEPPDSQTWQLINEAYHVAFHMIDGQPRVGSSSKLSVTKP